MPDVVSQARLFHRLRWQMLRNSSRVVADRSWLRIATILVCSLVVWGSVFAISYLGYHFLERRGLPLVGGLIGILFDLLFIALLIMLLFSSGIILYSSLFASAETAFLLCTPARADRVFAHKYLGAVAFSSWAFLLLGSPILIAYGMVFHTPWWFYALLPFFFLGFALLPGSLGALFCLLVVNFVPRQRKQVLIASIGVVLIGLIYWGYSVAHTEQKETWSRDHVTALVGRFTFTQGPLVPSHWMAEGLQASVRGEVGDTLYYLSLLWSNGLFLYTLTAWASTVLYRRGYNRMATGGTLRKRYGGAWLDRGMTALVSFLDPQIRLLIVKDFRTFRRDPAQWAQILIFTGLLILYFMNIRRLELQEINWNYRNGISLLNLTATALLLCVYTSRFIYPMLSLEGRKFWILGLLPLRRERLLWGKLAFSATGSLLIAELLIVLSDVMLDMPLIAVILHIVTIAALALGLSGLSVGLGACMPNFRETDPSKIAVGFGGTLNLVAGLGFLIFAIVFISGVWHGQALNQEGSELTIPEANWGIASAVAVGVIGSILATVVPLHFGARTLRRMEF